MATRQKRGHLPPERHRARIAVHEIYKPLRAVSIGRPTIAMLAHNFNVQGGRVTRNISRRKGLSTLPRFALVGLEPRGQVNLADFPVRI